MAKRGNPGPGIHGGGRKRRRRDGRDRHGGSALSEKDATKPDRFGVYVARWAAKSLVAGGYCRRCLVQLSYTIGVGHPVSVMVDSYGTCAGKGGTTEGDLAGLVESKFDLRPGVVVKDLDLRRTIMRKTEAYGHFGREEEEFKWEKVKEI